MIIEPYTKVTLKDPIERGLKATVEIHLFTPQSMSYTQRPDRKGTERNSLFATSRSSILSVTLKDPIERGLKVRCLRVLRRLILTSYTQRPDRKGTESALAEPYRIPFNMKLHSKTR